jgi:hypothetical protein
MLAGERVDRIHVRWLAVKVDGHDGLGPRVMARSIAWASILWVSGFGSTATGVAPHSLTASQVAMKVFEGTITSSPGPTW